MPAAELESPDITAETVLLGDEDDQPQTDDLERNAGIPDPDQLQPRFPDYDRVGWTMVFSLERLLRRRNAADRRTIIDAVFTNGSQYSTQPMTAQVEAAWRNELYNYFSIHF
jgi:hypothetical protein